MKKTLTIILILIAFQGFAQSKLIKITYEKQNNIVLNIDRIHITNFNDTLNVAKIGYTETIIVDGNIIEDYKVQPIEFQLSKLNIFKAAFLDSIKAKRNLLDGEITVE